MITFVNTFKPFVLNFTFWQLTYFLSSKFNLKFFVSIVKPSARLNKGNQKLMVSANKQTPKRQTTNRKVTKTSSSSLASNVIVKDEELMPPPSSSVKPEYYLQCENADSTINSIRKLFQKILHLSFYFFIIFSTARMLLS